MTCIDTGTLHSPEMEGAQVRRRTFAVQAFELGEHDHKGRFRPISCDLMDVEP